MISSHSSSSTGGIDDVVIVGGGLAALLCALKLSPRPVTIFSGDPIGRGPIPVSLQVDLAAALHEWDIERHVADTVAAGGGLAEERVVRSMLGQAPARLQDLLDLGIAFERGLDGALLVAAVRRTPSVRIMEGFVAEQLRADGECVTGLVVRDRRGGLSDRLHVSTRAVVLASGGIGSLYALTGHPSAGRGEGIAIAARAGALIADPEFMEFNPTVPIGESTREPIPIAPTARFHMGGVHVDGAGRTTLDRLWACGEVAATGVHGASRLASNAMLETIVYAARIADDIRALLPTHTMTRWSGAQHGGMSVGPDEDDEALRTLRATMSRHVGVVRNRAGLSEALSTIERLAARARGPHVRNAVTTAKLVTAAALAREESRGAHYRSDFPQPDPRCASRTFITLDGAKAIAARATANSLPARLDLAS